jgi:hypothetical protein
VTRLLDNTEDPVYKLTGRSRTLQNDSHCHVRGEESFSSEWLAQRRIFYVALPLARHSGMVQAGIQRFCFSRIPDRNARE